MFQPAHHARLAVSNDDIIVLDLAADRYLGLPGAIVEEGVAVALPQGLVVMHSQAVETLAVAGLLIDGDLPDHRMIDVPKLAIDHYADPIAAPISVHDILDLVVVLVVTGWRVWRHSPCRRHETGRTTQGCTLDQATLRTYLARLDRLRLFIPTPRRCLPSSLVTCLWLNGKGVSAEIVFGVRTHPFEAHCWAECGGIVLDDALDRLQGFVPISVGVP